MSFCYGLFCHCCCFVVGFFFWFLLSQCIDISWQLDRNRLTVDLVLNIFLILPEVLKIENPIFKVNNNIPFKILNANTAEMEIFP